MYILSLLLIFFLISIIFNPWQTTVFLPSKNFILQFFLPFTLIFTFFQKKIDFPKGIFWNSITLFWLWTLIHFRIFSERDSYFFLFLPILLPIIISQIKEKDLNKLLLFFIIIGTLLAIYGIFQYMGWDFSFWGRNIERNRVFGLFGNVNYFSFYLVPIFILAFTYFLVARGITKILYFIFTLILFISIGITFTRSSYIALLFSFFYILFFKKDLFKKNWVYIIVLLLILLLGLYTFVGFNTIRERILSAVHLQKGMGRRIIIWKISLSMIDSHALLWGKGIGWYGYMFPYYQVMYVKKRDIPYPSSVSFYAHNEFLQFLIELGIVGLILFALLIILFTREALKIPHPYNAISIAIIFSYLIISLSGFPLHLPHTGFLFWFFLSIPFIYKEKRKITINVFYKILILFIFGVSIFVYTNFYISHSYAFFKEYQDLVKINPYWGMAQVKVAVSHLKKGEIDKGIKELEFAKKIYMDFTVFYNLGLSYFEKGQHRKALKYFQEALIFTKNKKDKARVLKYMGVTYSILKDENKAREVFIDSIKLDPSDPETHYNLALTYKTLGNLTKCKEELDKALKLVGKNEFLKRAILNTKKTCK